MSQSSLWVIYGLRQDFDGSKYRYIGYTTKGVEERLRQHKTDSRRKTTPVCTWIRSSDYKILAEVIEVCPDGDIDYIFEREVYWINHYRSLQGSLEDKRTQYYLKNFCNGGGRGNLGLSLSEDHKESISKGVITHFEANGHKPVYDFWLEKYGKDEADRLHEELKNKRSEQMSGEGNNQFGKTGKDSTCYGRTGTKHPLYGKKFPESVIIKRSHTNHMRRHSKLDKPPRWPCRWCAGDIFEEELNKAKKREEAS